MCALGGSARPPYVSTSASLPRLMAAQRGDESTISVKRAGHVAVLLADRHALAPFEEQRGKAHRHPERLLE